MTAQQSRYQDAITAVCERWLKTLQAEIGQPVYTCPTWGIEIDGRYFTGYRAEVVCRLRNAGYNIESPDLNYYRLVA